MSLVPFRLLTLVALHCSTLRYECGAIQYDCNEECWLLRSAAWAALLGLSLPSEVFLYIYIYVYLFI